MSLITSLIVGILFAGGVVLLLRRSPVDLVFGLALLSTATIVLIIAAGGWEPEGQAPLLRSVAKQVETTALDPSAKEMRTSVYADPLPQALILTALVIGFGMLTFLIALVSRDPDTAEERERLP
jgi:multicomponent Na+:H+ antiporter subunit C